MAYTLNLTNGTVLTTLPDGTIDTVATSIKLVGKNYTGYGEILNENSVALLENFASNNAPVKPLTGQLWWDTNQGLLNAYDGIIFKTLANLATSIDPPATSIPGDFWWHDFNNQLYVKNSIDWTLIGPPFTAGAGKSGALVEIITDVGLTDHVVTMNYVSNNIISIHSKDPVFTPNTPVPGFATIHPGLTLAENTHLPDARFTGTATNADLLDGYDSEQFLRSDEDDTTTGIFTIDNDIGMYLGTGKDLHISVKPLDGDTVKIFNETRGAGLQIGTTNAAGAEVIAIDIDKTTKNISVHNVLIKDVAYPVNLTDATNKQYVDDEIFTQQAEVDLKTGQASGGSMFRNGSTTITGDYRPDSDSAVDWGHTNYRFDNLYADNMHGTVLNTTTVNTTFTNGDLVTTPEIRGGPTQLVISTGESHSAASGSGQTAERVYINAESGVQINTSPDNWVTGWANRDIITLDNGRVTAAEFTGTLLTPAQGNVTSLGTLTNLNVGSVNINGNTVTATNFTGVASNSTRLNNQTASYYLAAPNLNGALNDINVVQSNVTQHQAALTILASQISGQVPLGGTYQSVTEKNVANGYAGLDENGKLPSTQLPPLSITSTYTVATQAAQLALVVQEGDVAVRTDLLKSFIALNAINVTMADWQELLTPLAGVSSVAGKVGAVTLASSDLTDSSSLITTAGGQTIEGTLGLDSVITLDTFGTTTLIVKSANATTAAIDFKDSTDTQVGKLLFGSTSNFPWMGIYAGNTTMAYGFASTGLSLYYGGDRRIVPSAEGQELHGDSAASAPGTVELKMFPYKQWTSASILCNGSVNYTTLCGGDNIGHDATLQLFGSGHIAGGDISLTSNYGTVFKWEEAAGKLTLRTGSGTAKPEALTIDSNQNSTFGGDITVSSASSASLTLNDPGGTTKYTPAYTDYSVNNSTHNVLYDGVTVQRIAPAHTSHRIMGTGRQIWDGGNLTPLNILSAGNTNIWVTYDAATWSALSNVPSWATGVVIKIHAKELYPFTSPRVVFARHPSSNQGVTQSENMIFAVGNTTSSTNTTDGIWEATIPSSSGLIELFIGGGFMSGTLNIQYSGFVY